MCGVSCRGHGRVRRGDEVHGQRTWSREECEKLPSGRKSRVDTGEGWTSAGVDRGAGRRDCSGERGWRDGQSYRSVGIRFSPARECGEGEEGERDKERQRQRQRHTEPERREGGGGGKEGGREKKEEREKEGKKEGRESLSPCYRAVVQLPIFLVTSSLGDHRIPRAHSVSSAAPGNHSLTSV